MPPTSCGAWLTAAAAKAHFLPCMGLPTIIAVGRRQPSLRPPLQVSPGAWCESAPSPARPPQQESTVVPFSIGTVLILALWRRHRRTRWRGKGEQSRSHSVLCSCEPFGGVYARDWEVNTKRQQPRGLSHWLWVPALITTLAVSWSATQSWTRSVVGLCIMSFIAQWYWPRWEKEGVLLPSALRTPQEGHRLLTSSFLHDSWWHLCLNMYVLWQIGLPLEVLYGQRRFLFLLLGSGIGAAVTSVILTRNASSFHKGHASVGASGMVYGLVTALIVYRFRHGIPIREMWYALFINLAFMQFSRSVDHGAHIGGAAAGAMIAYIWGPRYISTMGNLFSRNAPLVSWPFV
eukprot:TRINITY_DN76237_c0_g1_i1.p1 TRINITY_DN76237_c0_g1~~TRINITY_DN76237_c0_g1_i1.p1  ORF type:complete len:347 (+),score=15.77 TRINITY_DN76237_c0_g1_i1:72-1112(+)